MSAKVAPIAVRDFSRETGSSRPHTILIFDYVPTVTSTRFIDLLQSLGVVVVVVSPCCSHPPLLPLYLVTLPLYLVTGKVPVHLVLLINA